MKDYYQILGVSRAASQDEIKHAFRRLAIVYHPDKNPSKEAESFIKEIIEAYEILDDPPQRALYDSLITGNVQTEPVIVTQTHRDPRYRRRAPAPDPNYKSPKQEMLEMMQEYMHYSLFISRCTFLFSLVLLIDFLWPALQQTEVITQFGGSGHSVRRSYENSGRLTTDKGSFEISRAGMGKLKKGESITVFYSRWLDVPLQFRNNQSKEVVKIPATIYGNFIFAPLFLLAFSTTGVAYRKGIMFRFNLGIVNFLLLILNVLFLFIHHLHIP